METKETDWGKIYQERQRTPEEAVSNLQSGMKVALTAFCGEPQTLLEELIRQKNRLYDVTIYASVAGSPCLYAASDCSATLQIRTFLGSPLLKDAYVNQACDYIPINLSEVPSFIENERIDAAFIQVSPPNEKGYCNLGISVDYTHALIRNARLVVAEVNSEMPWTYGNTQVHVSSIDCFVRTSRSLLKVFQGTPNAVEQQIGEFVAELIPDRSTIQVGIGNISDSIVRSLASKKELGVHSGSISDAVIDLVEQGVITGGQKEVDRDKLVCTTLIGSGRLYRYAHNNPMIELHPVNYTHDGRTMAQFSAFYSINSALEVDLTGQINAEQVGDFPVAGVGGQMDFIRGSGLSSKGKAIIALPSTAQKGMKSRIKLSVSYVTSLKSDVHYVVTEFGIASLFGKSLKERKEELIAVAHPDFREQLEFEYRKVN